MMVCPGCRAAMTPLVLESHYGRSVTIDLCRACQAFWFDDLESLQLDQSSVLQLFRIVGQADQHARPPIPRGALCPRCGSPLVKTVDQQRHSTFEYQRCPDGCGRLTSFHSFLREKDFVTPLSPEQIEQLRVTLRSVNCSNCGAPVDVRHGAACDHCGSQLSLLDVRKANAAAEAFTRWLG